MARTSQVGSRWAAVRMRRYSLVITLVAMLGALAVPAASQERGVAPVIERGKNEIGFGGVASVAATPLISTSTDLDFGLAALRCGRTLWENGGLSFDWTIDIVPVAILSLDRSPDSTDGEHETVYGAGLAPIGFRVAYEALGWCRPYFAATGGFLAFAERIPATGSKFNFTYDFGAGAQIPMTADTAVTVGYTYYHISNGGIGDSNPGFDSNVL